MMLLIILIVLIAVSVVWWLNRERSLSANEILYLRRRGYEIEPEVETGPPVASDARLFSLIESLGDVSAFSRRRAAEELSRMCREGRGDSRMLSSLIAALDDNDASVRSAVAAALGNLGDAQAVEPLNRRMELDESIQVRAAARNALDKLKVKGGASG